VSDSDHILKLYQSLHQIVPFQEGEWEEMQSYVHVLKLKKKEYFLKMGEKAYREGFVASGLMRLFYLDVEGKETNRGFALEGSYCGGSTAGVFSGQPAIFSIQALEPSILVTLSLSELKSTSYFKNVESLFLKKALAYREQREQMMLLDAESRYFRFLNNKKILSKRLPQHHIASYLGIDPATLSRLKKK